MSAFQDAPKPWIMRFIRCFTNFSFDPYYDPLSLVMIYIYMLNKNTLGVKKVQGQEEAAEAAL